MQETSMSVRIYYSSQVEEDDDNNEYEYEEGRADDNTLQVPNESLVKCEHRLHPVSDWVNHIFTSKFFPHIFFHRFLCINIPCNKETSASSFPELYITNNYLLIFIFLEDTYNNKKCSPDSNSNRIDTIKG